MDYWSVRLASVPADGSCFYTSIAIALNESIHIWKHNESIKAMLKMYWNAYRTLGVESADNFTPKFIRYMTSMSIDDDDLSTYNNIAQVDGKVKMDSADDLAEHVLVSNCWVDTTTFGAFLKSLECRIAVVVLDHELKQPLNMPDDLTKNKDFYICLLLKDSHYQPMQVVYKDYELGTMLSRESIRKFMEDCYPDHRKRF